MSETNGFNVPKAENEFENSFYESFFRSALDELYETLDDETDVLKSAIVFYELAKIDPLGVAPYVDRALARTDIVEPGSEIDYYFLSLALARTNRFEDALKLINRHAENKEGEERSAFTSDIELIPETLLERAAISFATDTDFVSSVVWLRVLGDAQPTIRPTVLALMQDNIGNTTPDQSPEELDVCLQQLSLSAATYGENALARQAYERIGAYNMRLSVEISIAKETKQFLDHRSFDEIKQRINDPATPITPEERVYLFIELDEARDDAEKGVDVSEVRGWAMNIDQPDSRLRALSKIAREYNDDEALSLAIEQVPRVNIASRGTVLNWLAYDHGDQVFTRCVGDVLEILLGGEGTETEQYFRCSLAQRLVIGTAQQGQTEEALDLLSDFEGNIEKFRPDKAYQAIVCETARKGPEFLDKAVELLAQNPRKETFYHGKLLSAIATGGADYLSPREMEEYVTSSGSDYMTFSGLITLAKELQDVSFLIKAKMHVKSEDRLSGLLEIAKAYAKITKI